MREAGISDLSWVINSGTLNVSTSSSGAPRTSSVSIDDAAIQIAHALHDVSRGAVLVTERRRRNLGEIGFGDAVELRL